MLKIEDIATKDYERVVVFRDDCGFFCCIAIHRTKLGPALGGCRIFPYQSEHAALIDALRLSQGMEHRTQNQTDADAERIGFLIELHCVLEPVLHRCSSYGTDRGNGIAMDLYVAYPSIQHRVFASESRRARPREAMTPSFPNR